MSLSYAKMLSMMKNKTHMKLGSSGNRIVLAIFALSFSVPALAFADAAKVNFDQSKGTTTFHAVGRPSAIKINGTGTGPAGSLVWNSAGKVNGDLLFDLSSLDTGISMRTNHMKEKYLEVGKYPKAKLTLTEVSIPAKDFGKDFTESRVPFKGNLELHGVTKPVSGTAQIEQHGSTVKVHAELPVKITDYKIPVPVFAGITVADDVSLVIDANAPITKKL
jgi:polyisoprenoid-binding protein YceI